MKDNPKKALGLIETKGCVPLVTAVDGAIKAARVSLESETLTGGGLVTAAVSGDVGSVKAAMSAAEAVIAAMGATGMTHVIVRPDAAVWAMLAKDGLNVGDNGPQEPTPPPPKAKRERERPVPAVRAEAKAPQAAPKPQVPAVKEEAKPPAVKNKAGTPSAAPVKTGDKPKAVKKTRKSAGKKK